MASKANRKRQQLEEIRETADGPHADGGKWHRAGDPRTEPDLLDAIQEGDDRRFQLELQRVHERLGYTSEGVPLSGSAMAQLAGEDRGWQRAGSSAFDAYPDRVSMNTYLTERFHVTGPAKNIIRAYTTFTYGTGWWPTFKSKAQQAKFDAWAELVEWGEQVTKMVRETFLYGSAPTVIYPLTWGPNAKNLTDARRQPGLMRPRSGVPPTFRVLPDSRLLGIETGAGDYMKPLAYKFSDGSGGEYLVAPQDVILPTTEALGTSLRGASVLTPVLEWIVRLEKLANSRFYMNLTRSRLPVVRTVTGGKPPTTNGDVNVNIKKLPPAGSVVTEYGGVKWEMPAMNIDSSGAAGDWRLLVLLIASGVGLPEYLVLQDASNSNYASTLVASGPAHSMFLSYQEIFRVKLTRLLNACGWTDYTLQPPPVVPPNIKEQAAGHNSLVAGGIESKRSAAEAMGLDFDQELERMAQDEESNLFEDEDDLPPAPPVPTPPPTDKAKGAEKPAA